MEHAVKENTNKTSPNKQGSFFCKSTQSPFFSPVFVQPKLTIGPVDDPYEREADAIADRVMRMPATENHPAIFQNSPLPITFVQRQCATCEQEDKLQRKENDEEDEIIQSKAAKDFDIQRKYPDCEEEEKVQMKGESGLQGGITPNLKFKESSDQFEQETDSLADQVKRNSTTNAVNEDGQALQAKRLPIPTGLQQVCKSCEKEIIQRQEIDGEEEPLQGKPLMMKSLNVSGGFMASPRLESQLERSKGGGNPLPNHTLKFMNNAFKADFSKVRVHTDNQAVVMTQSIGAQAFTNETDIFFNQGFYQAHSTAGKRLLAHELTHVVQQKPNSVRKKSQLMTALPDIQASYYFWPTDGDSRKRGELIHENILPAFQKLNKDTFVEVSIPNATAMKEHSDSAGVVDFYRAKNKGNTIGVKFEGDEPRNLRKNTRLKPDSYNHLTQSAPHFRDGKTEQKLKRLEEAPTEIELGDLKPGGGVAGLIGSADQIPNYVSGLENAEEKTNKFVTDPKNKDRFERPSIPNWQWRLSTDYLKSLNIPPFLEYSTGSGGGQLRQLGVFLNGNKINTNSTLKGSLYVYKAPEPGIWAYEYIPNPLPSNIGSKYVDAALTRLRTEVIPTLRTKRLPQQSYNKGEWTITNNIVVNRLQRKPFNHNNWTNTTFKPWHDEAKTTLMDATKAGSAPVASALVNLKDRSKLPINLSPDVVKTDLAYTKIQHWVKHGGKYGMMRNYFGTLFSKVANLFDNLKTKFDAAIGKQKAPSTGDEYKKSLIKKAFGLAMKVVSKNTLLVLNHLKTVITTNTQKVLSGFFGETNMSILLNDESVVDKLQSALGISETFSIDHLVDKIMEPFQIILNEVSAVQNWLTKINDILKWMKRAVYVIQCLTPPGVGCLKIALNWLLKKMGADVMGQLINRVLKTCWFQREFILPVFNEFQFFKEMPNNIISAISTPVMGLFPSTIQPFLQDIFPNPDTPTSITANDLEECKEELTPAQMAMAELAEKHGVKKVELLIKLMEKTKVGEGVELDLGHVNQFDTILDKVKEEEIEKALENLDDPAIIAQMTGVGDLAKLVENIKEQHIDKRKDELALKIHLDGFSMSIASQNDWDKIVTFLDDRKPGILENLKINFIVEIEKPDKHPHFAGKGDGVSKNRFTGNSTFSVIKEQTVHEENTFSSVILLNTGDRKISAMNGFYGYFPLPRRVTLGLWVWAPEGWVKTR